MSKLRSRNLSAENAIGGAHEVDARKIRAVIQRVEQGMAVRNVGERVALMTASPRSGAQVDGVRLKVPALSSGALVPPGLPARPGVFTPALPRLKPFPPLRACFTPPGATECVP